MYGLKEKKMGKTYITSGLGFVNRICYYITEVARKEDETITVEDN